MNESITDVVLRRGLAAIWFMKIRNSGEGWGGVFFVSYLRNTKNLLKAQGETMVKKELEKLKMELGEKFLNQLFVIPLFRYSVITSL